MHNDDMMDESTWTPPVDEQAQEGHAAGDMTRLPSLMSVLSPTTPPPVPRNARVICRLGLVSSEAQSHPPPQPSPVTGSPAKTSMGSSRSEGRRAARALRKMSLGASAGLKKY
jgi:hypothetical protein